MYCVSTCRSHRPRQIHFLCILMADSYLLLRHCFVSCCAGFNHATRWKIPTAVEMEHNEVPPHKSEQASPVESLLHQKAKEDELSQSWHATLIQGWWSQYAIAALQMTITMCLPHRPTCALLQPLPAASLLFKFINEWRRRPNEHASSDGWIWRGQCKMCARQCSDRNRPFNPAAEHSCRGHRRKFVCRLSPSLATNIQAHSDALY
jgi:hypothetical protein